MQTTLIILLSFIQQYFVFSTLSRFFEKTSTYKILSICFSIINTIILVSGLYYDVTFHQVYYLAYTLILIFQTSVLYIGPLKTKITSILTINLHFFSFRTASLAMFSIIQQESLFSLLSSLDLVNGLTMYALILHTLSFVLFNKVVSEEKIKNIFEDDALFNFATFIIILLSIFMVFNTALYNTNSLGFSVELAVQQIILPMVLLTVFYTTLFMTIKILGLSYYQKKSEKLEEIIEKEKNLKSAMYVFAGTLLEINCTKNKVIRIINNEKEIELGRYDDYDLVLNLLRSTAVNEEHIACFDNMTSKMLIDRYESGITEGEFEFEGFDFNASTKERDESKKLWHRFRYSVKKDHSTDDIISIFTINEIHDEKITQLELKRRSEIDDLTDVYNKVTVYNKINAYLESDNVGTLFMIDLDNFKLVNDNMGHHIGDNVLKDVVNEIKSCFRQSEIIGRIGGDEFIVLMLGTTSDKLINEKANSLCEKINRVYNDGSGYSVNISASIGISRAPVDGTSYDELFPKADEAMYQSKNTGKNNYTIYQG